MSEEVKDVAVSISRVGVSVSRVIEYLPATLGDGVIARDCGYEGLAYSKGSVIMVKDRYQKCSGDKDGNWKDAGPVK
jgi:Protein of unknown function (DUF1496)